MCVTAFRIPKVNPTSLKVISCFRFTAYEFAFSLFYFVVTLFILICILCFLVYSYTHSCGHSWEVAFTNPLFLSHTETGQPSAIAQGIFLIITRDYFFVYNDVILYFLRGKNPWIFSFSIFLVSIHSWGRVVLEFRIS